MFPRPFPSPGGWLAPVLLLSAIGLAEAQQKVKTIHVFVALCDNQNQGIVPVPAKLGNGEDPANNLYWGAMYGVKTFLKKHADWDLLTTLENSEQEVLERCIFRHRTKEIFLVADAYRGRSIKTAVKDFLDAAAGNRPRIRAVTLNGQSLLLQLSGRADLVAYVGHNGLMDFKVDPPKPKHERTDKRSAMVFCCRSDAYFQDLFKITRTTGLVTTFGLMAPEGYVLAAAVGSWVDGDPELTMRRNAAAAYQQYQKCSQSAANQLFGALR